MNIKKLVLALSCASLMAVVQAADTDRHYPAPSTVSEQMAALVNAPAPALWYSDPKTLQDWEQMAGSYAKAAGEAASKTAADRGVKVESSKLAGVPVFTLTPKKIDENKKDKVIFYIHGGGYVLGHGVSGITEAIPMAAQNHYKVISVDYRMAPQHPFPAAIDDAFAAYKEVVKQYGAENIAVFGTSTGGAMTLILGLQAHAEGRQMMPAALIAGTPWADLDKIGDSYVVNEGVDNVLGTYDHLIRAAAQVYADGHDLKDPLISPVYASDSILKDFPPTLLVSGTRDLFLSNTVRMHTRLLANRAPTELIVYEAVSHAQYYFDTNAPETRQHYQFLDDFLARVWKQK